MEVCDSDGNVSKPVFDYWVGTGYLDGGAFLEELTTDLIQEGRCGNDWAV